MTITFASLTRIRTRAELRDAMLTALGAAGFPVTSWREGGTARTLLEVTAEGVSQAWDLARTVALGSLLPLAEGDWLTALANSHFAVDRIAATYTRGQVRLTAGVGIGPYNIPPAGLVVSDGTRLYRSTNTTTLVLTLGGTLDVPVRAEGAGTIYNAAALATLITPALPGVTLTSPAVAPSSTWRTVDARDAETDQELRRRCVARWATLASGFTRDAVTYWATTATFTDGTPVGCTRVGFAPPPGDGSYVVYVAGATGALGATGTARVQAVLNDRKPITDTPVVTDAIEQVVAVSGTITVLPEHNTTANRDAIRASLDAHFAGRGIGDARGVDLGALYAAIYAGGQGVVDVDLTAPTADVTVAAGRVVRCDYAGLTLIT